MERPSQPRLLGFERHLSGYEGWNKGSATYKLETSAAALWLYDHARLSEGHSRILGDAVAISLFLRGSRALPSPEPEQPQTQPHKN